jgi:hypothetical protein
MSWAAWASRTAQRDLAFEELDPVVAVEVDGRRATVDLDTGSSDVAAIGKEVSESASQRP